MINVRNSRRVVKGFLHIKDLICGILIVFLLLCICVTVDYADENITANATVLNDTNCTLVNGTHYSLCDDSGIAKVHKVVVEKPKYPLISMWAKPSVRSSYSYRWYRKTFIDYCPHCKRYNVLLKNPKGVPEREYTCRRCGADYCAVTGKEKYSYSRYYLRRA